MLTHNYRHKRKAQKKTSNFRLRVKSQWATKLVDGTKRIENRNWKIPERWKGNWIEIFDTGKAQVVGSVKFGEEVSLKRSYEISEQYTNPKYKYHWTVIAYKSLKAIESKQPKITSFYKKAKPEIMKIADVRKMNGHVDTRGQWDIDEPFGLPP